LKLNHRIKLHVVYDQMYIYCYG